MGPSHRAVVSVVAAYYLIYSFTTFTHLHEFPSLERTISSKFRGTENNHWTSKDGLLEDISNSTLGVRLSFLLYIQAMMWVNTPLVWENLCLKLTGENWSSWCVDLAKCRERHGDRVFEWRGWGWNFGEGSASGKSWWLRSWASWGVASPHERHLRVRTLDYVFWISLIFIESFAKTCRALWSLKMILIGMFD